MASESRSSEHTLLLKHTSPVNGMISIEFEIQNLPLTFDDDHYDIFTLFHAFDEIDDGAEMHWSHFVSSYIEQFESSYNTNTFQLKVPLRLLSYSLHFSLQYQSFPSTIVTDNHLSQSEFDLSQPLLTAKSTTHTVQIPSILIESTYNIGDVVLYNVEGCGFVRYGVITDVMDNKKMKLRRLYDHQPEHESESLTVHASDLSRPTQNAEHVVDITDRKHMECELILRSNEQNAATMYCELCDVLSTICGLFYVEDEVYHGSHMASLISTYICQCLYAPDYTYRFECLFCNTFLFSNNQWEFSIAEYAHQIQNGIQMTEIQRARDCMGYSCDICRVELSWYEISYHCYGRPRHDFCVSCVHSLLTQQSEMKAYLSQILNGRVTDDCILEIVKFCAGNVQRFYYIFHDS
eukprot:627530_1